MNHNGLGNNLEGRDKSDFQSYHTTPKSVRRMIPGDSDIYMYTV